MNSELLKSINNPFKFNLFLLAKLPIGFIAGLKLVEATPTKAVVTIRYQYITKNPFQSIYFACLAMAAELASGTLGLIYTMGLKPDVSMLIVKMEAEFIKKGKGKVFFTCTDGDLMKTAAYETKATGEPRTVVSTSIGKDINGIEIARFKFTWSFKAKDIMPRL